MAEVASLTESSAYGVPIQLEEAEERHKAIVNTFQGEEERKTYLDDRERAVKRSDTPLDHIGPELSLETNAFAVTFNHRSRIFKWAVTFSLQGGQGLALDDGAGRGRGRISQRGRGERGGRGGRGGRGAGGRMGGGADPQLPPPPGGQVVPVPEQGGGNQRIPPRLAKQLVAGLLEADFPGGLENYVYNGRNDLLFINHEPTQPHLQATQVINGNTWQVTIQRTDRTHAVEDLHLSGQMDGQEGNISDLRAALDVIFLEAARTASPPEQRDVLRGMGTVTYVSANTVVGENGRPAPMYPLPHTQHEVMFGIKQAFAFFPAATLAQGLRLCPDAVQQVFFRRNTLLSSIIQSIRTRAGVANPMSRMVRESEREKMKRALQGVKVQARGVGQAQDGKPRELEVASFLESSADYPQQALGGRTFAEFEANNGRQTNVPQLNPVRVRDIRDRTECTRCADHIRVYVGQKRARMDLDIQREASRRVRLQPAQRKQRLLDFVQNRAKMVPEQGEEQSPLLAQLGAVVDPSMSQVGGQLLPAPVIQYGERGTAGSATLFDPGSNGAWNDTETSYWRPAKLRSFGIVSMVDRREVEMSGSQNNRRDIRGFVKMVLRRCQERGMSIPNTARAFPQVVYVRDGNNMVANVAQSMHRATQVAHQTFQVNCEIIFVLLPKFSNPLYQAAKAASDKELHIPSQCFCLNTAGLGTMGQQPVPQVVHQLSNKINVKLGGVNQRLYDSRGEGFSGLPFAPTRIETASTALVGIAIVRSLNASFAGMVVSVDEANTRFAFKTLVLPERQAIIPNEAIAEPFLALLKERRRQMGRVTPKRVVVFRQGIAEAALEELRLNEIEGMMQRLPQPKPTISLVLVQSKHKHRLFTDDPQLIDEGAAHNLRPGVMADRGIGSFQFESWLQCCHVGSAGSTRPAKMVVARDENNLGSNALGLISFWMSHTQCRSNRTCQEPAPLQYARWAAKRQMAVYLHKERLQEQPVQPQQLQAIELDQVPKCQMYYV